MSERYSKIRIWSPGIYKALTAVIGISFLPTYLAGSRPVRRCECLRDLARSTDLGFQHFEGRGSRTVISRAAWAGVASCVKR